MVRMCSLAASRSVACLLCVDDFADFVALQVDEKEMEAEIEKEIERMMEEEKKQAPPKKTPDSDSDTSVSDVEGMFVRLF